ncbi:delta-60 repeat domain-containing protein [Hymenobacter sp. PAMC29290]|nr:delta-60 repeat domain-containing protein [Hymenobacter siberiensis]
MIRLLPTGRLDTSFATRAGFTNGTGGYGEIRRIIAQPDGTIMVAGQFDAVDGQPCLGVARLSATGSRDASFSSPLVSYAFVFDMVRQPDGKLVLGGNTVASSTNGSSLVVRLLPTGALDPSFTRVAASGVVFGLGLRADGSILVTGGLNSFGGLSSTGLVRLTSAGAVDAAFGAGSQGNYGTVMRAVELNSGQYLIVGFFNSSGSQPSSGVMRLLATGNVDTSYTMLLETVASGLVTPQNNGQLVLSAYNLTTFNGQAVSTQGYPRFHRISANGSYNALITLPAPTARPGGSTYSVNASAQADGTFYATYQNTDSTALVRRVLANGTFDATFAAAELRWSRPYPPCCLGASIAVHPGGGLLVTSSSTKANGQPMRTMVRLNADGTLNTQFAPPLNTAWQVLAVGTGNTAGFRYPVGLANGQTLVLWNDATRSYADRLNLDGTIDNTFSIGTGGGPGSLFSIVVVAGGKIMANGNFTSFNGQAAPYGLLRLLPSGAPDPGFTAASAAHTLAEQPDGKLLIVAPGATSQTERLVRLITTGSFDTGFQAVVVGNESFSPAAATVYLQPGTNAIVLGGDFTSVAGQPRFGLARLVNTVLATRNATAVPLADAFPNRPITSSPCACPPRPPAPCCWPTCRAARCAAGRWRRPAARCRWVASRRACTCWASPPRPAKAGSVLPSNKPESNLSAKRKKPASLAESRLFAFNYRVAAGCYSVAMSITKRYFTSPFSMRSYDSLMSFMSMSSMSDMMLCSAQKSSISCVSAMPPMSEPAMRRRLLMRLKAWMCGASVGTPSKIMVPSRRSRFT